MNDEQQQVTPETPADQSATAAQPAEAEAAERRLQKTLEGTVVSNRMQKSVVVRVERQVRHSLYQKTIRKSSKFMAHDEENKCRVGDRVVIRETRPISKRKNWRVISIISSPQQ
ncbi:MAG: 30S ribosomal protein S17 [Acidobacteria bacterium]|nr:MAG: 30S ribosomal protein S17 [Acidobacteriota bacterium]